YYPAALHLQSYEAAVPVDSSRALSQGVRDPETNMFLDLFRDGIMADIARAQPDIVGISIPSMPQMLAAMTLAYLIKESGLPIHVTVGGPHVSMLRDELVKAPAIWSLIDSAVVFDGEIGLLELVRALEQGGDLAGVPNLIYCDDAGDVHVNARNTPEKITNLPPPDFDGLPLDRYLAPKL
ncbi:MAG: cobalamin-dependent protein, partial [Caldilineaceae bacterium]|nr:cobalamin-dependent protein [Caldilineaceae bacterium]